MEPNNWPEARVPHSDATERMSPQDYFGHHALDEKEALKLHSADTPEGLRRALSEQMGGAEAVVRPRPNEL